jgi:hypothetical protein
VSAHYQLQEQRNHPAAKPHGFSKGVRVVGYVLFDKLTGPIQEKSDLVKNHPVARFGEQSKGFEGSVLDLRRRIILHSSKQSLAHMGVAL